MSDDNFSALLEDYHYGELDDVTAARLMTHLRGCNNCRTALSELEQENQVYQAYADSIERDLDVTPAMWEGVRVRMNEVSPVASTQMGWAARLSQSLSAMFAGISPAMRQVAFAAVIVVISVAGTLLVVRMTSDKQPQPYVAGSDKKNPVPVPESPKREAPGNNAIAATGSTPKEPERVAPKRQSVKPDNGSPIRKINDEVASDTSDSNQIALQQRILKLRKDYVEAIDVLSASVNKRKSKLDPKLLAVFNRNLNIVNESIAALRKAYAGNPTDAELAKDMLTAYAKKVELLQEIDSAITGE